MKLAKYLLFLGLALSAGGQLMAQDAGEIVITSRPPGATVYLNGEYDLVANTPARLPIDVSGRYKARVTRPGYETWKGELTFVPGSANEIDIRLKMKTRFRAALRSSLIPGWGQIYYGNSQRGTILMSAAIISAASIIYADRIYGDRSRDYSVALANFSAASSIEDKNRLKIILDASQRDAYDAETNRNMTIAIGAAAWALNVLDALVFFPESDIFYPTVTSLGDGLSVTFSAGF